VREDSEVALTSDQAQRYGRAVQRALGDYAGAAVTEAAWPALLATLVQVDRMHRDPEQVLKETAAELPLDKARSVSAWVTWRIRQKLGLPQGTGPGRAPSVDAEAAAAFVADTPPPAPAQPRPTPKPSPPPASGTPAPARPVAMVALDGHLGDIAGVEPVIAGQPAAQPRPAPSAETKDLHALVDDLLGSLASGADWADWLAVSARYPRYGVDNVTLIHAQRPQATLLATAPIWERDGHTVRTGETGVRIIAPVVPVDSASTPGIFEQAVTVFDQEQLENPPASPATVSRQEQQALAGRAVGALTSAAIAAGFLVDYSDPGEIAPRAAGGAALTVWKEHRIHLKADLPAASAVRALAHELGHILLHDATALPARTQPLSTVGCRGVRRMEAESVAFIVTARLGIDVSSFAFPAVSSWAGSDERSRPERIIRDVGERILGAADRIGHAATSQEHDASPQARPRRDIAPQETPGQQRTTSVDAELPARAADTAARAAARRTQAETTAALAAPLPKRDKDPVLLAIHADAQIFFETHLHDDWVPAYLQGRKFTADHQRDWHVGFAPDTATALTEYLFRVSAERKRPYTASQLLASGLVKHGRTGNLIDRFRNRLTLPIRDLDGDIVAFNGRKPGDDANDRNPKWLNSPNTALFKKGEALFGLFEQRHALAAGARPVFSEGSLDAMAVCIAASDRYVGLGMMGTALSSAQVALVRQVADLNQTGACMATDDDDAGRKATVKTFDVLRPAIPAAYDAPSLLTGVAFRDGQDPAEVFEDDGPAVLGATLDDGQRPLADVVLKAAIERSMELFSVDKTPDSTRFADETAGPLFAMRNTVTTIAAMQRPQVRAQIVDLVASHLEGKSDLELSNAAYRLSSQTFRDVVDVLPAQALSHLQRVTERFRSDYLDTFTAFITKVVELESAPKRLARAGRAQPQRQGRNRPDAAAAEMVHQEHPPASRRLSQPTAAPWPSPNTSTTTARSPGRAR
jgi:DNA primase